MYVISRTKKFFFAFLKEEGKKDDDDDGRRKKYARRDKKKRESFLSIYYLYKRAFFFVCAFLRLRFFLRVKEPLDLWSVSRRRAMMMKRFPSNLRSFRRRRRNDRGRL